MRRARSWVSALVMLAVLGACGGDSLDYGGKDGTVLAPAPTGPAEHTRSTGTPRVVVDPPQATAGLVRFRVTDRRNGAARAGIPVTYRKLPSGRDFTVFTVAGGAVDLTLARGDYQARVVTGCAPTMVVRYGSSGRFGVAGGKTLVVPLQTEASYRFVASGPITWSPDPPWRQRTNIDFGFRLISHIDCGGDDAPKTSLGPLRVKTTGRLALVSVSPRSDESSNILVKIRCTGYGSAQLLLEDPSDPSNSVDLLRFRAAFAPGNWCGQT